MFIYLCMSAKKIIILLTIIMDFDLQNKNVLQFSLENSMPSSIFKVRNQFSNGYSNV